MKILLVKRDKIGDMLLTTPLLTHLRRALPDAQIDVLANDYNAWVAQHHPAVDRMWIYPRTRHDGRLRWPALMAQLSQRAALRRNRYDVAIAANGDPSPRAVTRALAVMAGRTIAYVDASSRRAPRLTSLPSCGNDVHEIERLLGLAAPVCGIPATTLSIPQFTVPTAWCNEARKWLATCGMASGNYMVVGTGARYAATQPAVVQVLRWAQYAKQNLNWDTAVHYTPGEASNQAYPGSESLAVALRSAAPSYVHLIPPRIELAIAVIELAGANIIPDGGLMHFAAISPGGVVGLFASESTLSSPSRWGPRGHRVAVVDATRQISDVADDQVLTAMLRCRSNAALAAMAIGSR
jgi:heptosyltransferase-3